MLPFALTFGIATQAKVLQWGGDQSVVHNYKHLKQISIYILYDDNRNKLRILKFTSSVTVYIHLTYQLFNLLKLGFQFSVYASKDRLSAIL